jgi:SHS2 domain-containing protein
MDMKKSELLDISGDVGLRIWGENLEELFQNAALSMTELITDLKKISASEKKEISLQSDSYERLLVIWLNELIFLFDAYGFIGTSFSVHLESTTLNADISGGIIKPEIHESRLLLKAATYHGLTMKKTNSIWEATVIFDI